MKYTFLHISDLHYRTNWHEENDLVCNRFFEDIQSQIRSCENRYLIFSGDIVLEGAKSEFYAAIETNFSKKLNAAGFLYDNRICTPGNHDISRDALKPLLIIQKATLEQMTNEQLFNDHLPQNAQTFLESKFNNYKKFEEKFAKYTACESDIGGSGWALSDDVGVYCLNTALCSFGGLSDSENKYISDQNKLMIDTRSLHKWLSETEFKTRILVMHHPLDWLVEWAKSELEKIISSSFQLVFSGHIHENSATFSNRGFGNSFHCVAPPLFTKKSELLGYSFINFDASNGTIEVVYRQWSSKNQKFVLGTSLAGDDSGKIVFVPSSKNYIPIEFDTSVSNVTTDTLSILQFEFEEAITCYSSTKRLWVDRDIANMPETHSDRADIVMMTQNDLVENFRPCIIRAPKQFGLTCLGRYVSLEHYRLNATTIVMIDMTEILICKNGVISYVESRCKELNILKNSIAGFIIDNCLFDKRTRAILRNLKSVYINTPIVLLEGVDDCAQIANAIEIENDEVVEILYLWALTKARIRELVVKYLQGTSSLDDNLVTKKIVEDIDALNIYRTPDNCLLILKLFEQAFDDTPVNRTEMIGRVLYFLFYQFNKIPSYATRPDLKDCEYALGFFCEWLIRSGKKSFSKNDFYIKVQEYCSLQILDLDIEVLFAFLAMEHIFVRKGTEFEFRFNYWLYFFAAHRMHHDPNFAEFILTDRRYSAFPEIIEFYAGIDRRRSDAVNRLTEDLMNMNADFLKRTSISADFNPLRHALWTPKNESLEKLKQEVELSMTESSLPSAIKDAIADHGYNRAKPYNQELATFINETSLKQMIHAMKGAARALRNSDHVTPEAKTRLLEEVVTCWIRVCQILVMLSPILAHHREAAFEGMGFYLDKSFDEIKSPQDKWERIMTVIVDNVVGWYQDDIFSKKMGALLSNYNKNNQSSLGELLVLLVIVKQRPPNWEKEVEQFIVREHKNSFYLSKVFDALRCEFKFSFSTERNRQELRRLAAMALAKHDKGTIVRNKKQIEATAKRFDEAPPEKKGFVWRFVKPRNRK
ncbi:metallophosphoesterase [Methylomonas sp. AM2-LC]|uniref:metallophosphoesterase family protein n=1 Tax=Methylomonas sp. AM2-LC TaxID=3153301 RepID=UPI003265CC40